MDPVKASARERVLDRAAAHPKSHELATGDQCLLPGRDCGDRAIRPAD
jgi:hypothetical protein